MLCKTIQPAGGIGPGGGGLADQVAEVDEMFVAGGALTEVGLGPFFDEDLWCHSWDAP
jgi:hypothetical protein